MARSRLAFQAHSPAGAAQVHDPEPGGAGRSCSIASEPTPAAACAPLLERQDLHGYRAAVAADPGQQAELPFHDFRAADLLVQRCLPR